MTLKKNKGTFKPKGPKGPSARATPASAQSSARPSVERQSQTPGPVTKPTVTITIPDDEEDAEEDAHTETAAADGILQPPTLEPTNNTPSTENSRKRPREENEQPPDIVEKRARVEGPQSVHNTPTTNSRDTEPEVHSQVEAEFSTQNEVADTVTQDSDEVADASRLDPAINHDSEAATPQNPVLEPSGPGSSTDNITFTHAGEEDIGRGYDHSSSANNGLPETPHVQQDDPASIYPDPELSGIPVQAAAASRMDNSADSAEQPAAHVVPTATLNPDGTAGEAAQTPSAKPRKKRPTVRRRRIQPAQEGDDGRATIEMQLNRPRRIVGGRRGGKKDKEGRKKRGETPEGASDEEVDPTTMTLMDLCKDPKIGQKSDMHDEIQKRVREKKMKDRLAKRKLLPPEEGEEGEDRERPAEGADGAALAAQTLAVLPSVEEPINRTGPQMRLVDGQIVMDPASLIVDRHARTAAEDEALTVIEENEFTHVTTSGSWMKREKAQVWTFLDVEKLYQGIAQFGTDFEMIAKLFPSRNRRQIKLKFNKEERTNPVRLNAVLMGKSERIDLMEWQEQSGLELEEVETIEAERRAIDEEHAREEEARRKEMEESIRQKRAAITANSAAARRAAGDGSEKENENAGAGGNGEGEDGGIARSGTREASAAPGKTKKKTAPKKRQKKNPHTSQVRATEEVLASWE